MVPQAQELIGESVPMQEIKAYIAKVAATDSTVVVSGETGTDKELVASLIHRESPRRNKPFICVNCVALLDSLVESELFGHEKGAFTGAHTFFPGKLMLAHGGTIFFDEIGDMSLYAQAKFLRVIETGEIQRLGGRRNERVSVRVIAATNRELEQSVNSGQFRSDLYFRLQVASIQLPALREHKVAHDHVPTYGEAPDQSRDQAARQKGRTPPRTSCNVWPINERQSP